VQPTEPGIGLNVFSHESGFTPPACSSIRDLPVHPAADLGLRSPTCTQAFGRGGDRKGAAPGKDPAGARARGAVLAESSVFARSALSGATSQISIAVLRSPEPNGPHRRRGVDIARALMNDKKN